MRPPEGVGYFSVVYGGIRVLCVYLQSEDCTGCKSIQDGIQRYKGDALNYCYLKNYSSEIKNSILLGGVIFCLNC